MGTLWEQGEGMRKGTWQWCAQPYEHAPASSIKLAAKEDGIGQSVQPGDRAEAGKLQPEERVTGPLRSLDEAHTRSVGL
jgi:hypothetical protein